MKKLFYFTITLVSMTISAQVGIGVETANINASAQLEVASTTKGFLPPRLTASQRDAINAPAAGLVLWCTNCGTKGELQVYNGTEWTNSTGGSASIIPPIQDLTPRVTIGTQVWTSTNLDVSTYRNGDIIPQVTDPNDWGNLTTGAWCYYNNDSANGTTYGKMYNWYAVNDPRGLAPVGYHIPTNMEWNTLADSSGYPGDILKANDGSWPYSDYDSLSNSSGFTALPGGGRYINFSPTTTWNDINKGRTSYWWSSDLDNNQVQFRFFDTNVTFRLSLGLNSYLNGSGFYVRCIKD